MKKKILAIWLMFAMICTAWGGVEVTAADKETASNEKTQDVKELLIDGSSCNTNPAMAFRGVGAVSCNNSSRLLMDYKEENPTAYWEIMNWLFKEDSGAGLTHVKVELGCDLDTSSGAEPATKRSKDEPANVARGAGFMFAHDAQTINPAIKIELLRWGEPGWVAKAVDENGKNTAGAIYAARYQWMKETMDAAYALYGMKVDYIGACQNEKGVRFPDIADDGTVDDKEDNALMWILYLSDALKKETAGAYDYSKVQITAADQVDTTDLLSYMLYDRDVEDGVKGEVEDTPDEKKRCELAKELREAISVVGVHYHLDLKGIDKRRVELLTTEYGKEFWHSEGSPSMTSGVNGHNATNEGSDMAGAGGVLNVANRIVASYCNSNQTLYLYQPSVAAYYDGAVYFPKQLMTANTPWSGFYSVDAGIPATMHFTGFIKQGWQFVDSGCLYDGATSGHNCGSTNNTYLTAANASTGDYSSVIVNDSSETRNYHVTVKNLAKAAAGVAVWETRQADEGQKFDSSWLKQIATLTPATGSDGAYVYDISVKPYSMVTLTTLTGQKSYAECAAVTAANAFDKDTVLSLPYKDDFSYDSAYVARRGGTPRYTTDLNGAFEVCTDAAGNQVLRQIINAQTEPSGWGGSASEALTSLGDDRWSNYTATVDTRFASSVASKKNNFVALGVRYNTNVAKSGCRMSLYQDGSWQIDNCGSRIASGKVNLQEGAWNSLSLSVYERELIAKINGEVVAKEIMIKGLAASGRVCFATAFENNEFDNLTVSGDVQMQTADGKEIQTVTPADGYAVTRLDDLADALQFSSEWKREDSLSYSYYGRTYSSAAKKGAKLTYSFTGTGLHLIGSGTGKETAIKVELDGKVIEKNYKVSSVGTRQAFYMVSGLPQGQHTVIVTLLGGGIGIDAVETLQGTQNAESYFVLTDTAELDLAGKKTLNLSPVEYGTSGGEITYTSSDDKVLTVADGKAKAKSIGVCKVTATNEAGYTHSFYICVKQSPMSVKVKKKKLVIKAGKKAKISYTLQPKKLTSKKVIWKSSNKKVATVSASGVVKAKKKGTCTITLTTVNGKTAKVKVQVR